MPCPSESVLQQQFGISRMTVNRAMKELAVEGVVTRVQGSGTVVAQLHRISTTLALRDIHEEITERGHQPRDARAGGRTRQGGRRARAGVQGASRHAACSIPCCSIWRTASRSSWRTATSTRRQPPATWA